MHEQSLMYDALELGKFKYDESGKLKLVLNEGINVAWLPVQFYLAYLHDVDMKPILKAWKKERVFPMNRVNSFIMLLKLGLLWYSVEKIAYKTRCSVINDPYWLTYEDTDRFRVNTARGTLGDGLFPYNSIGLHEEDYIWKI